MFVISDYFTFITDILTVEWIRTLIKYDLIIFCKGNFKYIAKVQEQGNCLHACKAHFASFRDVTFERWCSFVFIILLAYKGNSGNALLANILDII